MPRPGDQEVGRRLQERRKIAGDTQQTIAERLGVSRATVAAIEAGQRILAPQLVVQLAEAYRLGVSDLLRVTTPPASLAAQFRTPGLVDASEREQLERAVASLEVVVEDYLYLEQIVDAPMMAPAPPSYRSMRTGRVQDAEVVADTERRRLGVGDGPVYRLRQFMERELGVRVFSLPLPNGVAGLFGWSAAAGACMAMNAAHPHTRQRWTLAHELGHCLTDTEVPEVTHVARYQRQPERERFAEAFAAAFLMPRSGLERHLREIKARGQPVVADLLVVARDYEVSPQALVLRIEDLGLVAPGLWDRLQAARLDIGEALRVLGLDAVTSDRRLLPARFELLALEAFARELLTERQLADLMRVDRLAARELVREIGERDLPHTSLDPSAPLRLGG